MLDWLISLVAALVKNEVFFFFFWLQWNFQDLSGKNRCHSHHGTFQT